MPRPQRSYPQARSPYRTYHPNGTLKKVYPNPTYYARMIVTGQFHSVDGVDWTMCDASIHTRDGRHERFYCTLPDNHPGMHVATGNTKPDCNEIYASWPNRHNLGTKKQSVKGEKDERRA